MKSASLNDEPQPSNSWSRPKLIASLALATAGIVAILTVSKSEPSEEPTTLALVDGAPITAAQFLHAWEKQGLPDSPEAREQILERLVQRTALAQQARELGIDRDPAFIHDVQRLLISRLKEAQLDEQLATMQVTDEQLRERYDSVKAERYTRQEKRRVAALWLNSRGRPELEQRFVEKLGTSLEQFRKAPVAVDQGFGNLALANTEHRPSRFKGGVVGWVDDRLASDPWKAQLWEIANELEQPGDLSPIVACEQGVFVVRLLEVMPAQVIPFETVAAEITREHRAIMARQLEEEFENQALEASEVEILADHLAELDLPHPPGKRSSAPGTLTLNTNSNQ